ncbi:hypothetical protein SAMN05660284_01256 [Formivibrio citricus]|uniref:Uncharacterized protein n=1 Tax=Formivibrio citricus TaxID=83765 RepID=A0A1I4Y7U6_9NEIS|nr:hypothetical protein SAMN05660284_01256 [Formivibrio citricus]
MNGVFPAQPFGFGVFRAAFCVANRLQYSYCGALCALKSISNYPKRSFVTNVNRTCTTLIDAGYNPHMRATPRDMP